MSERSFEDRPAMRERVPLLIGLAGPSGSGKTFSALRLATGMQRVTGGEIYVVDTEARRSLHYADQFKFRHVEFGAPFSPLDYLEVIEHCVRKGAGVVVIDSMSHEHEGPGGVLEWHEREMGGDFKKQFLAWAKPKAARRRLINTILQLGVNAVFCFRAKEKIRLPAKGDPDREPKEMGWMPIAGEEFVYEMTTNVLLYPGSGGVPTWHPTLPGERAMTKLPIQFAGIFEKEQPLSEEIGQSLALWAAGDVKPPDASAVQSVLALIAACDTREALTDVAQVTRAKAWTPEQKATIKIALDAHNAKLKGVAAPSAPAEGPSGRSEDSETSGGAASDTGAPATDGTESPAGAPVSGSAFDAHGNCRMCDRHEEFVREHGHAKGCEWGR